MTPPLGLGPLIGSACGIGGERSQYHGPRLACSLCVRHAGILFLFVPFLSACFDGSSNNNAPVDPVAAEEPPVHRIIFVAKEDPQTRSNLNAMHQAPGPLEPGALYMLETDNPSAPVMLAEGPTESSTGVQAFWWLQERQQVLLARLMELGDQPGAQLIRLVLVDIDAPSDGLQVLPLAFNGFPERISADQRWMADRAWDHRFLQVIDLDDPLVAIEIPNPLGSFDFGSITFSSDSTQLFFTTRGRLYSVFLESPGNPTLLYDPGVDYCIDALRPSRDSRFFVFTLNDQGVCQPYTDRHVVSLDLDSGLAQELGGAVPQGHVISGWLNYYEDRDEVYYWLADGIREEFGAIFQSIGQVRLVHLDTPWQSTRITGDIEESSHISVYYVSPYSRHNVYQVDYDRWYVVDLDALDAGQGDATVLAQLLTEGGGWPVFTPDGRSVVMGHRFGLMPRTEIPNIFLIDLDDPEVRVPLIPELADDEQVCRFNLTQNGETVFYTVKKKVSDPIELQCVHGRPVGLYSVDLAAPGVVAEWLDASVGLDDFQVWPK